MLTILHQKRNDIIPLFAKLLISRTPVRRTCDILKVIPTTILRTYYNFCCTYEVEKGVKKTPAQRIGLTDKVFQFKDIIYLK